MGVVGVVVVVRVLLRCERKHALYRESGWELSEGGWCAERERELVLVLVLVLVRARVRRLVLVLVLVRESGSVKLPVVVVDLLIC